jgi:hypothetical protein
VTGPARITCTSPFQRPCILAAQPHTHSLFLLKLSWQPFLILTWASADKAQASIAVTFLLHCMYVKQRSKCQVSPLLILCCVHSEEWLSDVSEGVLVSVSLVPPLLRWERTSQDVRIYMCLLVCTRRETFIPSHHNWLKHEITDFTVTFALGMLN